MMMTAVGIGGYAVQWYNGAMAAVGRGKESVDAGRCVFLGGSSYLWSGVDP
jgi:hypothetical protein